MQLRSSLLNLENKKQKKEITNSVTNNLTNPKPATTTEQKCQVPLRGFKQTCIALNVAIYLLLLKTGSLDNAIREFSLVKPPWYMSH